MKSKNIKKIIKNQNDEKEASWFSIVGDCFNEFDVVGKTSLLGLMVCILVNKKCKLFADIAIEEQSSDKLGFMRLLANKGSINLNVKINYEHLRIYNCHLESGNSENNLLHRSQ